MCLLHYYTPNVLSRAHHSSLTIIYLIKSISYTNLARRNQANGGDFTGLFGEIRYDRDGISYFFNESVIAALDEKIKTANELGMRVYLRTVYEKLPLEGVTDAEETERRVSLVNR